MPKSRVMESRICNRNGGFGLGDAGILGGGSRPESLSITSCASIFETGSPCRRVEDGRGYRRRVGAVVLTPTRLLPIQGGADGDLG